MEKQNKHLDFSKGINQHFAMFSSSVICLLLVASLHVCCAQDVDIKIVNPDLPESPSGLLLKYQTTETLVCMITNAPSDPVVTFGFQDQQINNGLNLTPVKKVEPVGNKFNVNVSITFATKGTMNMKYMVCSFDGHEETAYIYMYFPPLLTIKSMQSMPSTSNTTFVTDCETISVPETRIEWLLNGDSLARSGIRHTENQACHSRQNTNFESNSPKFICRSNLTLMDLTIDIIGSRLKCSYNYLGQLSESVETVMDFYYPPSEITLESKSLKAADWSSDGLIEMTCSTSSTNPYRTLSWRDGHRFLNMSSFPVVVTKTNEYNGNLLSQTVQVPVTKADNGKTFDCCVLEKCGSTVIQVSWLDKIVYPSMDDYKVYEGSDLTVPCYVDAHPAPLIGWYKGNSKLSDNSANKTNLLGLDLKNIQKADSGSYICTAKLIVDGNSEPLVTQTKTMYLIVIAVPALPVVRVIDSYNEKFPSILIDTVQKSSQVPQTFYLQYKKDSSSTWLEFSKPFSDSLPGQRPLTHSFEISDLALAPGQYNLRVKSLSMDGMVAFTDVQSFSVKEDETEEMVTKSSRTTGILVGVFVTAGVFIAIIVVGIVLMKRGVCSSSGGASFN